jgi:molecular chaperone GrpE
MSEQTTLELAARIEALQMTVAALEKQIGRAGREQLKANALAEHQAERLAESLAALHAAEERREAELEAVQAQRSAAVAEARLELARAVFPTVDGLDEALRAGRAMLAHAARREPPAALLQRLLLGAEAREMGRTTELQTTLEPWLEGLAMVRRRLLDALTAEGITTISAEGRAFDPRQHIAVEVVAGAAPPGTVVQELRRGFMAGERVLRLAEVAVATDHS